MPGTPQISRVYWTAFKTTGAVQIQNVQEVQMQFGRRRITDLLTAGTATVYGRRPDLLPSLVIGDSVYLRMNFQYPGQPAGPDPYNEYDFRVANLTIEYGETSSMDTWVLELEDALAYLGRASLDTLTIASGTSTATAAATIATAAGLTQTTVSGTTTATSAQTVTGQNAMDVYQNLVNTEAAWIDCTGTSLSWYPRNVWQDNIVYHDFTDDNTEINYDDYRVSSLADNYADKVVISPRGSTAVVVGTGIFSYNLDTFSFNNSDAFSLGEFWNASLRIDYSTPRQISALVNNNYYIITNAMTQGNLTGVRIKFRGVTSTSIVTGVQIFGTVESTNVTLYLSSVNFLAYLVLDSQVYGYLDFNLLGW